MQAALKAVGSAYDWPALRTQGALMIAEAETRELKKNLVIFTNMVAYAKANSEQTTR